MQGDQMGRDYMEDTGVDVWTDHQEVGWGGMNWTALA